VQIFYQEETIALYDEQI